jgi:hypothetical protein
VDPHAVWVDLEAQLTATHSSLDLVATARWGTVQEKSMYHFTRSIL